MAPARLHLASLLVFAAIFGQAEAWAKLVLCEHNRWRRIGGLQSRPRHLYRCSMSMTTESTLGEGDR